MDTLEKKFDQLGEWVSQFTIEGKRYGGEYDVLKDPRWNYFSQSFPTVGSVLELGSFEGGHTVLLSKHTPKVVGIESRDYLIARAKFILDLHRVGQNVDLVQADLETTDLSSLGKFDVCFNVGVLYHMTRPWELVEKISQITDKMFLWTQFCGEDQVNFSDGGYQGCKMMEHGFEDARSGMKNYSFWLTLPDLQRLLRLKGFNKQVVHETGINHVDSCHVLMSVWKE